MLDWNKYMAIAHKFQYKAKKQDQNDLKHNIILSLAVAQRNKEEQLTLKAMFQIAKYECQKYWRHVKRTGRVISLDTIISNGDGHVTELSEMIEDDKRDDIDSRLSAEMELNAYPERLLSIGNKILLGRALSNKEHQYLWRFRRKTEKPEVLSQRSISTN